MLMSSPFSLHVFLQHLLQLGNNTWSCHWIPGGGEGGFFFAAAAISGLINSSFSFSFALARSFSRSQYKHELKKNKERSLHRIFSLNLTTDSLSVGETPEGRVRSEVCQRLEKKLQQMQDYLLFLIEETLERPEKMIS